MSKKVLVLKASPRKQSTGELATKWVVDTLKANYADDQVTVVDLATYSLPWNAEPYVPAAAPGEYVSEEVKAWSKEVSSADAVVVVVPEYNSSYPGVFKHAVDLLSTEWAGKKVVVVGYSPSGAFYVVPETTNLLTKVGAQVTAKLAVQSYVLGYEPKTGLSKDFANVANTDAQGNLVFALSTLH
ncbi:hypothetical protein CKF54_05905 [Psittacicella hinzii]|uniref:NADPH-dependent FMN reductase-like domain-containing protein n=1 Tax=Psittacicella hinzii TaxID=2028575 RepID=A0A3A1Y153_9GAMM|nr:NAD(P)H-dependent oxidoreductase [Psittacicella hinzii]RIY31973.1 hypothetical protein CKF54_05905 [Psittacicella hinzii]